MSVSPDLKAFIEGPLSDKRGGTEAARSAALSAYASTESTASHSRTKLEARRFQLSSTKPLFAYQESLSNQASEWIRSTTDSPSCMLSLPTGGGKTRTALCFVRRELAETTLTRIVWVAPSTELVDQAVEAVTRLWKEFPGTDQVTVHLNELPRTSKQSPTICFLTAQTAARRLRKLEIFRPELLIFDEAHQACARTYSELVSKCLDADGSRVMGLSATPGRVGNEEGFDLRELFSNRILISDELGNNPVGRLQELGVLSKLEFHTIPLPRQWEQLRVQQDGRRATLDRLALHPARFWATMNVLRQLDDECSALVFTSSTAHTYAILGALRAEGITAEAVSHRTPSRVRERAIAGFTAGAYRILVNHRILATGYDCPRVTDVVLAAPISSEILWEQILGRASRGPAVGGTEVGHVWELDDHRRLHSNVLSYARYIGELWS